MTKNFLFRHMVAYQPRPTVCEFYARVLYGSDSLEACLAVRQDAKRRHMDESLDAPARGINYKRALPVEACYPIEEIKRCLSTAPADEGDMSRRQHIPTCEYCGPIALHAYLDEWRHEKGATSPNHPE